MHHIKFCTVLSQAILDPCFCGVFFPGPFGPGGPQSLKRSRKRVTIDYFSTKLTLFRLCFGLFRAGPRCPQRIDFGLFLPLWARRAQRTPVAGRSFCNGRLSFLRCSPLIHRCRRCTLTCRCCIPSCRCSGRCHCREQYGCVKSGGRCSRCSPCGFPISPARCWAILIILSPQLSEVHSLMLDPLVSTSL